jgi:hypothetical protein
MKYFSIGIFLVHLSVFAQNTSKDLNNENNTPSAALASDDVLSSFNPSTEKSFFWSDINQEWELSTLNDYEYDNEGRLLKSVYSFSPGELTGEIEYTYDITGNILTETSRFYDEQTSQMIDETRATYQYNEFGDQTYFTFQTYTEGNWNTIETDSIEISYNNAGFQLSYTIKNYLNNVLTDINATSNVYDTLNRLLSKEVVIDNGDGFIPFWRIELTYEDDLFPISKTEFIYDSELEMLQETRRYTQLVYQSYTSYYENVPISFIIQDKIADVWVNSIKSETTFEGANSVELISEFVSGFWILKTRKTKNFDEQGLPVLDLEEFRNDENWQTESAEEYINEYSGDFSEIYKITLKIWDDKFQSNQNFLMRLFNDPVNIKKVNTTFNFSIFPNPAQDNVVIKNNQSVIQSPVMMHLFDINGRSINKRILQNTEENVNIKNLKTGVYFIHLSDNKGKMKTEKLIVR